MWTTNYKIFIPVRLMNFCFWHDNQIFPPEIFSGQRYWIDIDKGLIRFPFMRRDNWKTSSLSLRYNLSRWHSESIPWIKRHERKNRNPEEWNEESLLILIDNSWALIRIPIFRFNTVISPLPLIKLKVYSPAYKR